MHFIIGGALFLSILSLAGGACLAEALTGFAVLVLVLVASVIALLFLAAYPSATLAFAFGAVALLFLLGKLATWFLALDAWFGQREAQRRAARAAAGGDPLSGRERKLKAAWDRGRAERDGPPRPSAIPFALGRVLGRALRPLCRCPGA